MNDLIPPLDPTALPPLPAPMTFGQILDRVYRLLRANTRVFVAVAAIPAAAFFALYALTVAGMYFSGLLPQTTQHPDPAAVLLFVIPVFLVLATAGTVFYALYNAAASYAALQAEQGAAATVSQAYGHAWSHLGRYLWLIVLRGLLIVAPALLCWLVAIAGFFLMRQWSNGSLSPGALFLLLPLGILLYVGSVVYAIFMGLRYSLAYPACVAEGLTARAALKQSARLTESAKGRIFLALLVIYAVGYALFLVSSAVALVVFAVGAFAAALGHFHPQGPVLIAGMVLLAVLGFGAMFLWIALQEAGYSTAFVVLYKDQRLRKEGPQNGLNESEKA